MQSHNFVNIRENLAEVISLVVNVDPEAVEDKLTQLYETENLILLLENEEVINEIDLNIYCEKTGHLIGSWDESSVSYLVQTIGKERAKEVIKIKSRNQIHATWLFTDDKALTKLADTDPVGYFIYSIATILNPLNPLSQLYGTFKENDARAELYRIRAVSHENAAKLPLNAIIRINELMRRFLSITQTVTAYKHLAIPELQLTIVTSSLSKLEEFEQGLQETLANLIRDEQRRGRLRQNVTYQEVLDLKLHYKGHSNFRNQRRLKSMTETEHMALLLKDFMPDATPLQVQMRAGKEPEPAGVELKTHSGELNLNIQEPKKKAINLSFAQILKRRK